MGMLMMIEEKFKVLKEVYEIEDFLVKIEWDNWKKNCLKRKK